MLTRISMGDGHCDYKFGSMTLFQTNRMLRAKAAPFWGPRLTPGGLDTSSLASPRLWIHVL